MTRYELVKHNGYLHIVISDHFGSEPLELRWYYDLGVSVFAWAGRYRDTAEALAALPMKLKPIGANGLYEEATDGVQVRQLFRLPRDQPACHHERIAIPCPKVRAGIETRWNSQGYWQKYLKSKGWVRV